MPGTVPLSQSSGWLVPDDVSGCDVTMGTPTATLGEHPGFRPSVTAPEKPNDR